MADDLLMPESIAQSIILNEREPNFKCRHFEWAPFLKWTYHWGPPFYNMATSAVLLKLVLTNLKFQLALSAILKGRHF